MEIDSFASEISVLTMVELVEAEEDADECAPSSHFPHSWIDHENDDANEIYETWIGAFRIQTDCSMNKNEINLK